MQSSLDTRTGSDVGTAGAELDDDASEAVPASAAAVSTPGGQSPASCGCLPAPCLTDRIVECHTLPENTKFWL